jgi:hypothetical protein
VQPNLAAVLIRRDASQEARADKEDLNALASKMKRILDEQARRHGIDV